MLLNLDILARLKLLGYLSPAAKAARTIAEAVRRFQHFYGLPESGIVDEATEKALLAPRCGMRDAIRVGDRFQWPDRVRQLRWHLESWAPGLTRSDWLTVNAEATAAWARVCGMRFERVDDPHDAHVLVKAAKRDGPRGILADAMLPAGNELRDPLELTFDERETWSASGGGIDPLAVACHEWGHILGLEHRPIADGPALLNPTYSATIRLPQAWDIAQVHVRYGPATPSSPSPDPVNPGGGSMGQKLWDLLMRLFAPLLEKGMKALFDWLSTWLEGLLKRAAGRLRSDPEASAKMLEDAAGVLSGMRALVA